MPVDYGLNQTVFNTYCNLEYRHIEYNKYICSFDK